MKMICYTVSTLVNFCCFFVCSYAIIYEKGYQKTEEVLSAVTTKVSGLGYTNGSGIFENAGKRVWDSSDYVVPPQVIMDHMISIATVYSCPYCV